MSKMHEYIWVLYLFYESNFTGSVSTAFYSVDIIRSTSVHLQYQNFPSSLLFQPAFCSRTQLTSIYFLEQVKKFLIPCYSFHHIKFYSCHHLIIDITVISIWTSISAETKLRKIIYACAGVPFAAVALHRRPCKVLPRAGACQGRETGGIGGPATVRGVGGGTVFPDRHAVGQDGCHGWVRQFICNGLLWYCIKNHWYSQFWTF